LAAAESEATGRQLAAMQARLLRMEALGARVVQVAALEDGEFTFDNPPAAGGPEAGNRALGGLELQRALADLAFDLRRREGELEVLEGLLRDRELRQATEIAGKPVARGWVSSAFGRRVDPIRGGSAFHAGIDFTARRGTEVLAVAGGVVIYAGVRHDFGNMVEVNHGDGYVTRYAHQHELRVNVGEVVKRGQVLGTVGATGRASGPHLHFEVLKHGRNVDPRQYIARSI
jgi:murein DD-endopeptidase MepM/ murein hydrolase activator NlpD